MVYEHMQQIGGRFWISVYASSCIRC